MSNLEHQICIMVTKKLHYFLLKEAKKRNLSMNELVRTALYSYLEKEKDYS